MLLKYAARSVVGKIRNENQDNVFVNGIIMPCRKDEFAYFSSSRESRQVFAVFDGMGGEENGHIASYIAAETLQGHMCEKKPFDYENYISIANERVCHYAEKHAIRMGTTLALLSFENNRVSAVNIGDSRIYYVSAGKMEQLSKDHTEFQIMLDAGIFTEKDFKSSDARNRLIQHIGIPKENMILSPYTTELTQIKNGDVFLLCSDGLSGTLEEDEILQAINSQQKLQEICDELVRMSMDCGSRDNVTAMVIKIVSI